MKTFKKAFRFFSLYLFLTLLIFSCKKDRADFDSIDFNVSLAEGGYDASWDGYNLGGFEFYKIYFSNQNFDPYNNLILSSLPTVLFNDQSTTSAFLDIGHFSRASYFVLSVKRNGREFFSNIVKVENPDLTEIDFIATHVFTYPQKK